MGRGGRRAACGVPVTMVTQKQLANMAAAAFAPYRDDVPDKVWLSVYEGQPFVRCTWANGLTCRRIERLEILQAALSETYGIKFTAVAYWHDYSWADVDRLEDRLQRVR